MGESDGGSMTAHHLLCAGLSYCAQALLPLLEGWEISATLRDPARAPMLRQHGVQPVPITPAHFDADALRSDVTHILLSAPPSGEGVDPFLDLLRPWMAQHPLQWVGYLSTTGVYGDHRGAWVDEESVAGPLGKRGARRVAAEQAWLDWGAQSGTPVHIFRLPGIYGPGRSAIESVASGQARRIVKADQVFSRIHVDDLAQTLFASFKRPHAGRAYNVCDDEPAPPQDVIAYAAHLLGRTPPPEIAFEEADLSPMAKSFYAENKRVRNDRIKTELGVRLSYPSYREGLKACLAAWQSRPIQG